MLECRELRYPVGILNFLEVDFFDHFITTTITIATNLSILSYVQWRVLGWSGSGACFASKLSILSNIPNTDKFLSDLVMVVLSIEVSDPANLCKV